jgi:hypothetical protein
MKHIFIKASALALLSLANFANAEDFYQKTKGYRVEPEPDPPSYVRNLSKTQFEQFRDVEWLDVGLDFRNRNEYRENDLRPWTDTSSGKSVTKYRNDPNDVWLLRTRAYVGVKDILDPLRFAVEFQDSRSYGDKYETTTNDVNEFELIQGYAELYFDNALGNNRPFNIRAGRQSFELLDKRLIANNQFRNTSNNFEGFRMRFGKQQNNWDLDTFGMQPIVRSKYNFDKADSNTWIYGGVFSVRQWSEFATIQPYLIGRKTNGDFKNNIADMDIYSPGLRVYGLVGDSGFDYDTDFTKQFGRYGKISSGKQTMQQQDALAYSLELGYTFDHEWKPRTSIYYGYGSGDKNGKDNINQHMDTFYGFNQPWSRNDYFSWENLHAPKVRLEFTPYKDVRIDTGYNAYWLANPTDAWKRAGLSDPTGKSGSFLGHEFDIRVRHQLNSYVDWSASYSRFNPGGFTETVSATLAGAQGTEASNFFYFEVSVNAFGDGKPKYK